MSDQPGGTMSDHSDPRLDRLLGPTAWEVGCEECFDRLDEFVELEVAGLDADGAVPGLRAHLDGCPACREEHDALVALVADDDRAT
jgi:hypothetical protein